MEKKEFLNILSKKLNKFGKENVEGVISYYDELISDKAETENKSESEIIAEFGEINALMRDISTEMLASGKQKNGLNGVKILLGVMASPILLPLMIAVAALYAVMFAVLLALAVAFGASAVAMPLYAVAAIFFAGSAARSLFFCGVGIAVSAIMLFLFWTVVKYGIKLINLTTVGISRKLRRKSK